MNTIKYGILKAYRGYEACAAHYAVVQLAKLQVRTQRWKEPCREGLPML